MRFPRLAPADWISLVIGIGVLTFLSVLVAASEGGAGTLVGVRAGGSEYRYPLQEDRTLEFQGPIGTTEVRVENGGVEVVSDPGRQQICVRQGRITEAGQWLACLPNEVFIRIYGDTERARVDGQTY